ncbi:TonB-dependent receptor domain-containing protein [uncultured Parasphingorhabdus sp.]|uniref:TonB-dependent receptor n=1 Tax=uncultured Parasphingorhabdus sp. TaxID=2709694 RepID=UPI002AA706B1|nr:TonB-dependent receptor [uncultured Parasphingorhabdus sp.]
MNHKKIVAPLTATTILSAFAPLAAQAQIQTEEAETSSSNVIVVTAQRREQNLQETPVTITALDSDALDQQGIVDVQGLARAVPNLQLLPATANPSTLQIGLRGGAEQVGGLIVSEPVVGIYIDDVYRARLQGSNSQLGDVERIEVLRGPQGTLYGRNNFSGALKIITRTPSATDEWVNGSIGYGSYDEVKATASVGTGLTDTMGASVSVLYRDVGEGYIYNRATGEDIGKEENIAVRGKLAFQDGPFEATLSATYSRDKNDGYIAVAGNLPRVPTGRTDFVTTDDITPRFGTDPYIVEYPQESSGRTETIAVSLNAAYDFGDITLRSITGYVDLEDDWRWDLAGGFEPSPGVYSAAFDRSAESTADQFSQELQLQGEALDGKLNWIVGGFYFRETGDQSITDDIPLFGLNNLDPTYLSIKTESYAAFAQVDYAVTDRATITVGGRYSVDHKDFDASIQSGFGTPNPRTAVSLREKFSSFTPKIGLDYEVSDDLFAYASISKGFKGGGFNGLSILDPSVLATAYEPQSVWAYEGGLKSTFMNGFGRANITVFYNDISGLQQSSLISPGSFAIQNVGDATVFGVEFELSLSPIEGFNLFANVGYQDGDYSFLDPTSQAAAAGGTDLPLVPDWTFQTGMNFEENLNDDLVMRIGIDGSYTGDSFSEVTNAIETKAYFRSNAFAAIATDDRRWELKFQVDNLTDEATYVAGFTGTTSPGFTILKPRTFLASLSFAM